MSVKEGSELNGEMHPNSFWKVLITISVLISNNNSSTFTIPFSCLVIVSGTSKPFPLLFSSRPVSR